MDTSLKTVKVRPDVKDRLEREQVRISTRNGKMASLTDVIEELLDAYDRSIGEHVKSIEDDLTPSQRTDLKAFAAALKSEPETAAMSSLRALAIRVVREWAKATEAGAR